MKTHPLVTNLLDAQLHGQLLPPQILLKINQQLLNGTGSHEPQPTSMSPKSDFIASKLGLFDDDTSSADPETLKTLGRWILDVADEAPDLTGVQIPERANATHTLHKEWTNTQPRSHHEVQAQLLKEAKQRGDDLQEQVLDLTEENNNHRAYAEHLRATATHSPGIEAQKKIILDLREQLKTSKERANSQYHQDQDTIRLYEELVAEDKKRIKSLEKQIMIDTRERNEANQTIADQKYQIAKYIGRQQFVIHKLLLAEQLTRLQDYIENEE